MKYLFLSLFLPVLIQTQTPHLNAHAHNDYEHVRPLFNALDNGFTSVEADVHLIDGQLLVSHNKPGKESRSLDQLYFYPLDSLVARNGRIFQNYDQPFYLMIDLKTDAKTTYEAVNLLLGRYSRLRCQDKFCPVRIFVSGNRPLDKIGSSETKGLAFDGRPEDLGKGYSTDDMPVISDHYKNWSNWSGHQKSTPHDLQRIRDLAHRVHAEGKKLRLWAIPDNELAWEELLGAGVDIINTDKLKELNEFLSKKGL